MRAAVTLDLDPSTELAPTIEPVKLQADEVVADHFKLIEEFRRDNGVSMWRARHVMGRFDCALLINEQGEEGFARVQSEFEMLGRIFHPNICRVFEAGSIDEEHHYIARAWVDGRSLSGLVWDGGVLGESQILICARQTAAAIQFLHSSGITHRNVKPVSIILDADNVVLIDLGMTDPDDTRSGSMMFRDPRVIETGWNEEADLYGLSLALLNEAAARQDKSLIYS